MLMGKTKNVKIMVSLKHLSAFWRTLSSFELGFKVLKE